MNFTLYCHKNKKNGKRYIGWCATSIKVRWAQHCKASRGNRRCYFQNAIKKWGSGDDAWEHEILELMTTLNGVKHAEKLWITHYKTFAYDEESLGYNETRGGDGTLGMRHTDATRSFLSEINTGENNPHFGKVGANKGRKFSRLTRNRMSLSHLGKKRSFEYCQQFSERQKRHVLQLTLDGVVIKEFSSLNEAREFKQNGQKSSIIGSCCRGCREQAYGFRWKFKDEF